jgi:large subunit ribosomal protein L10
MARADKAAAVAELTASFRDSSAAVLTEYRGLTVAELKELRRSLAGNATYSVVKNTLSKIAAREAGLDTLVPLLEGPSAIAFVSGDPVEVAKGLRNFTREHPLLVIKGGVLDGATISGDDIRKLADLESREVLLAKLAGGLLAPAQQLATVLAAPLRQLAQVLGAVAAKAEADPSILAGGAGTPAAAEDTPSADSQAPAAEEAPAEPETPAAEAESPAAEVAAEEAGSDAAAAEAEAPAADAVAAEAEAPAAEAAAETPADETPSTEPTEGVADASTDS